MARQSTNPRSVCPLVRFIGHSQGKIASVTRLKAGMISNAGPLGLTSGFRVQACFDVELLL